MHWAEKCEYRYTPFLNGTFPSVREYEIPAFQADMSTVRIGTNTPYFTPPLTPKDTVYTMWLGMHISHLYHLSWVNPITTTRFKIPIIVSLIPPP